ncbi:hypothetical protein ACFXAF_37485, partial [Kitasatospora sp. NPDC059463]
MTRTPPEGRPRRVACIGAGPAGLLAATQIKAARPGWSVDVYERAPEGETYGYGVVFSDTAVRTIDFIAPSLGRLLAAQVTWDAVEVRARWPPPPPPPPPDSGPHPPPPDTGS